MWDNMEQTRGQRLRRRGEAAHHAGHLRALRRLLRRLLPQGAEGAHPDPARFRRGFEQYDVLLAPVSPTPASRSARRRTTRSQMYLNDVFTLPANIAGLARHLRPCGFVDGLPVGLQMIGKPFDEATVLRAARAYESTAAWAEQRPRL